MSPTEQQIAIGKACPHLVFFRGNTPYWKDIFEPIEEFDPLNDLNAIHSAVKTLLFSQRKAYRRSLRTICSRALNGLMVDISECIDATAAQRAEAFCRVKYPEEFE